MKLCSKIVAPCLISAAAAIVGCAGPTQYSYQNVNVQLSAECSDCATIGQQYNPAYPAPSTSSGIAPAGSVLLMPNAGQGGTTTFTAHVTNAPANVTWTLYPTPNLEGVTLYPTCSITPSSTTTSCVPTESASKVGTITVASGNTAYFGQNGLPVYTGAALQQAQSLGIPQGDVLLVASVPADPNNPATVATASQLIQIYGTTTVYLTPRTPTNPSGLTNPVVTVARNAQFQFVGGAVGAPPCNGLGPLTSGGCGSGTGALSNFSTDNTVNWYTGPGSCGSGTPPATAVLGGSTVFGTITQTGLYTAPAAIPTSTYGTAGQAAIYVQSHLSPSVTACANVGIN
jgi:hypothetical protein